MVVVASVEMAVPVISSATMVAVVEILQALRDSLPQRAQKAARNGHREVGHPDRITSADRRDRRISQRIHA